MTIMREKTLSVRPVFRGRLLNVEVLEVELEPGIRSRREIVRHPGAVAVVARRPDGRFVFVRQYRKPVERGMLEVIAGGLEPGETPRAAAAREVAEESGYRIRALRSLGAICTAPGYTDEIIHLFYAELAADRIVREGDADERIAVEYLTRKDVETRMAQDGLVDGKTLAAWHQFTRGRGRQRSTRSSRARR